MEKAVAVTDVVPSPLPVEFTRPKATREVTKEFVRRPAKGWPDSTPVPAVRFDHHCAVWEP